MINIETRGITLIALIITIILMLILTGVVLSLTIGENRLFKTAKYAVQKNSEAEAKEKLELVLADLAAYKYTDETYNEDEYIDDYLENEDMEVSGSIVIIDNWSFEIDRSIPSIKTSLGVSTVKITKEVKEYLGKNENEKYMVSVLINIESNMKIESIEFENIDGTKLTTIPESQKISKDMQIELDKEYKVVIKIANGKVENRIIIERSTENIRTVEELVAFRDKVNSGLTYEGKTINLLNDINLSSVCGANVNGEQISWEPIGNYDIDNSHIFKGILNGNNKTINNLYINADRYYQGLFGINEGKIEKLIINGEILSTGRSIGAIVGFNFGEIVKCKNNAYVEGEGEVGGISGENHNIIEKCCNTGEIYASVGNIGGISGFGAYYIGKCYNTGYIHTGGITAGGIVGYKYSGESYNCYNTGEVEASGSVGGINGAARSSNTWNCYNIGGLIGDSYVGEITGCVNANGGSSQDVNCYSTNATVELLNAGAYSDNEWVDDVKIKDNETGEDVWKYNNGYPILKWQVEDK